MSQETTSSPPSVSCLSHKVQQEMDSFFSPILSSFEKIKVKEHVWCEYSCLLTILQTLSLLFLHTFDSEALFSILKYYCRFNHHMYLNICYWDHYHFLGTVYSEVLGTVDHLHKRLRFIDSHYTALSLSFFCFSRNFLLASFLAFMTSACPMVDPCAPPS